MTVERRTDRCPPTPDVIAAVVDLVDRKVDLTHPGKILLIQLFERETALAVVAPADTLTTTAAAASRPRAGSSPVASPECTAAEAPTAAAAMPNGVIWETTRTAQRRMIVDAGRGIRLAQDLGRRRGHDCT